MPQQLKRKSQLFIKSDVEGDWLHHIKQLQVDKGEWQMETVGLDLEDDDAQAWYWSDIHRLAESNEVITHSFEALVALLVDWLPVSRPGNLESVSLEEEVEPEDVEE